MEESRRRAQVRLKCRQEEPIGTGRVNHQAYLFSYRQVRHYDLKEGEGGREGDKKKKGKKRKRGK